MMKTNLLIFTFLLSFFTNALGGTAFTFNGKRELSFSEREFRRYILPKLGSIRRDFFSLFGHLNGLYPNLIKGERILSGVFLGHENTVNKCSEAAPECEQLLEELHGEFIRLEALLNKLEKEMKGPAPTGMSSDRYALWMKKHSDFHGEVLGIAEQLQQVLRLHGVNSAPSRAFSRELPHTLHSLRLSYERLFFSLLGEDQRKLFGEVYYSFISPIHKYVLITESKSYLKKNAEALNFAWNDFHMKVSKSNRSFPSKLLSQALQIHRHWVAILRVMLQG